MARIPDHEIERLKRRVSVERLVEAAGIELKPHGKDRVGRCPFHDDKTPSLVVSPKTNLWHCLGACQVGGSVIDWVMRFEGVSFRRAVELLRQEIGEAPAAVVRESVPVLAAEVAPAATLAPSDDAALLGRVIDYYHATLKASPEARVYLDARGIYSAEAIERFKLGYANRTLGYQLPEKQIKAGAEIRGALQRLGILRESGHEHFNGSLVVPVITPDGEIVEVYGRKVLPASKLRAGTPLHLYLPGPHRGVFNESGLVGYEEAILCEAPIDALTFWCAGYRNVTCAYGIEGFTADILEAFRRHGIKRVLIAYDADEAGDGAAEKLAGKLLADGFECYRCRFPKGMDANEYALAVKPAIKSLGVVIRQAEWMGKARADAPRPVSRSMLEIVPEDVGDVAQRAAVLMAERGKTAPAAAADEIALAVDVPFLAAELAAAKEEIPASEPVAMPELPAYRVPPAAPEIPVEINESGELRLALGDRAYTVRGIEKNTSYEQLRVWIKAACGDAFHVDTVELYAAKQRGGWLKQAAIELGLSEDVLRSDLGKLLRVVEQRQDQLIRAKLKPKTSEEAAPALPQEQQEAALALLKSPDLIERIVADVEATGVVGEASNALVAYLACVSRKLEKPLAILIQSTSAAGKSTLMDAVLALMPEAERVQYSAMTGQSLFYLGETSMKHKVLAIAEEEGVRQAAYALKLLQSQGELTIASTGKDPLTGELVTKEYRVEGPVMLFLTTTAIDIDEELLNRCLVLTIDESREQTAAIQQRQRTSRTLDGLLARTRANEVLTTHRAAQALLRPLAVVNPYAEQLSFASDRVRLRRDHAKYLALIDAIALLHQFQRPVKVAQAQGRQVEYIEVTLSDIALANRLAHEVLGRSLDELPPQTRRLLGSIQTLVSERAQARGIERGAVRIARRDIRELAGLSETAVRIHTDRLVALEYLLPHAGRAGQRFSYELAFDGDLASDARQAVGLFDPDTTTTSQGEVAASQGQQANPAPTSQVVRRPFAPTSPTVEMVVSAHPDADLLSLAAALSEDVVLEAPLPPTSRRNGAVVAATQN
ncbi:MAG: CHC2 zinc finger domain-containing protein [Planctomycetota bacterium]